MSRIVALIAVAVIAMFGIQGLSIAFQDSGQDIFVDSESWTPDAGNVTTLQYSNVNDAFYNDSVTVRDNNGKIMEEGQDYVWYESNGTIKTIQGGELDGAPSATIDYGYDLVNEKQKSLASLSGGVLQVIPPLLFVGLFALFIAFVRGAA